MTWLQIALAAAAAFIVVPFLLALLVAVTHAIAILWGGAWS
jgi:hypothetical protein